MSIPKLSLLLVMLTTTCLAYTQSLFISHSLSLFVPHGDFKDNIDRIPLGAAMHIIHDLEKAPWSLGIEGGNMRYANTDYFIKDRGGRLIPISEQNHLWHIRLLAQRHLLKTDYVRIYLQGGADLTTFYSKQQADVERSTDGPETGIHERRSHSTRPGLNYGAGVRLNLCGLISGDGAANDDIWLNFSVTNRHSGKAAYRNGGKTIISSLQEGAYYSYTNSTRIQLGMGCLF